MPWDQSDRGGRRRRDRNIIRTAAAAVDPMAGVSRDATSNIYCPANSTEWGIALTAAGIASGGPTSLWLCQEASGNLADSIGSNTLTANGAPAYAQAVGGWTRKAIVFTVDTVGQRASAVIAAFAPATHSTLSIAYIAFSATPAGTRRVLDIGDGGTAGYIEHQITTGKLAIHVGANTSATAATYSGIGVVPVVAKHNVTASAQALYTGTDKCIPTFAALTGTVQGIGATTGSSTGQVTLYMATFVDAAAELSDAQVKTLLITLGWVVTWT